MSDRQGMATLVGVHLPKTAGTTFLDVLRQAYGDGLLLDYGDRPLSHGRWHRRMMAARHAALHRGRGMDVRCVYGHFMPLKYSSMSGLRFCVWLRDPLQRILSRYHHYLRNASNEPHHVRWGLVPGLSLEQFVRLPQYQNSYAEYFWMFPLRRFDFIGIVEDYEAELQRFGRCFGFASMPHADSLNLNPHKHGQASYQIDPDLDRLIRKLNARDIEIYSRACERRRG